MLTSILRPSRGWAQVAGYDVVKNPVEVRAAVGVLTEQHGLYGRMPADDYLDFFGQLYGMNENARERRVDELLEKFGLDEDRNRKVAAYSKGMRQKLALARALLHDPRVLLLDEPTSAMDPESARLVRDSITALRSDDRAIIICTHNLAEAEELADKIAIIRRGKIIATGSPASLKESLLGPKEYRVKLASPLNGNIELPPEIGVNAQGPDWIQYSAKSPNQTNPKVLKFLLKNDLPVISLAPVPRSLEAVYLRAISSPDEAISSPDEEVRHAA
jgi:ABC-2 type transport system ATP-binding protein